MTKPLTLDIFSELQRADPINPSKEQQVYFDALEQARLADALGYGCWWTVEHHGAPRFSYSAVPEMMLCAIAQNTERIHLGHAGVLAPFNINHPIRVAERVAFVDKVSVAVGVGPEVAVLLKRGVLCSEDEGLKVHQAHEAVV